MYPKDASSENEDLGYLRENLKKSTMIEIEMIGGQRTLGGLMVQANES